MQEQERGVFYALAFLWESRWGENGSFRIAMGECGIDACMYAIDAISPEYPVYMDVMVRDNFADFGQKRVSGKFHKRLLTRSKHVSPQRQIRTSGFSFPICPLRTIPLRTFFLQSASMLQLRYQQVFFPPVDQAL